MLEKRYELFSTKSIEAITIRTDEPELEIFSKTLHLMLTAPFLRPAAARRMELNTVFVMDNRRILTG